MDSCDFTGTERSRLRHLTVVVMAALFAILGSAGVVSAMPYNYDVEPIPKPSARASAAEAVEAPTEYLADVEMRRLHVGEAVGARLRPADELSAPSGLADDLVDLTSSSRRSHILDGEVRPNGTYGGGHRAGTGFPGKSEFPASWSDDQIMHYISDVATDPLSTTVRTQGRDVFVAGTRDGIDIEVLIRNGEIWTAYPTNVPRNPG